MSINQTHVIAHQLANRSAHNGHFRIRLKSDARYFLIIQPFMDGFFLNSTAFFWVNYHFDTIFRVVFPPPSKVTEAPSLPLLNYPFNQELLKN